MNHATTWVLIANASQARLYACHGRFDQIDLVREFEHTASRAKGTELLTDRPGHSASGHGGRRTSLPSHTDARRHEHERFALEIVRELDAAHAAHRFDRLVLMASAQFLGMLKSQLSKGLVQAVTHTEDRDYTGVPVGELVKELRARLGPGGA